jgi:hypothetical protein
VTFDAVAESPVSSTASITVNGKHFTASRDVKLGQARWSGSDATLTPEDRSVLLPFDQALFAEFTKPVREKAQESVPAHQDLLARLSGLIAEAPLGIKFSSQDVPKPVTATTDTRFTPEGVPAVESCLQEVINTTDSGSESRRAAIAACQEANEDGILYFGSCSIANRTICHDADSHCFLCESVPSGVGSSVDCLGRCGPGCGLPPPVGGHGPYTYDCGDHDKCGRDHGGSLNPWDAECGDEYWEADDDFLWGSANC